MKLVAAADQAALVEGDRWIEVFYLEPGIQKVLQGRSIKDALLASSNPALEKILSDAKIPFTILDPAKFSRLQIPLASHHMIANIFGALYHFPSNDCIIVDMGPRIEVSCIAMDGKYLGGLFLDWKEIPKKPHAILSKAPEEQQSGHYFGLLGALERMIAEAKGTYPSPSSVMTVATGRATEEEELACDLAEFVDRVDPRLQLAGLQELLKL